MAALSELVNDQASGTLTLKHDRPVDLGGFRAVVRQSDTPTAEISGTFAVFAITIEVLEVTDPGLLEWLGHPVEKGAVITERVRIPLVAP